MTDDMLPAGEAGPRSVGGVVAPGFEPLGDAFSRVLAASHDDGGALHVRLDGKVIADMWGGNALGRSTVAPRHAKKAHLSLCTKGLASILAGELVREGRLDLDAPVSAYWPEFDLHDKGSMPVRWLFTHRAGLPAVRDDLHLMDVLNRDRMVAVLAEAEPMLLAG